MSYDVTVFFGASAELSLAEVGRVVADTIGTSLSSVEVHGCLLQRGSVLGMLVHLELRRSYLQELWGQTLSELRYQLTLTALAGSASHDVIHPVGLHLARALSWRLGGRTVFCLSGIEFLGAVFQGGSLVIDEMSKHAHLKVGPWRYESPQEIEEPGFST